MRAAPMLDVGGLYPDCDCLRVRSPTERVDALTQA